MLDHDAEGGDGPQSVDVGIALGRHADTHRDTQTECAPGRGVETAVRPRSRPARTRLLPHRSSRPRQSRVPRRVRACRATSARARPSPRSCPGRVSGGPRTRRAEQLAQAGAAPCARPSFVEMSFRGLIDRSRSRHSLRASASPSALAQVEAVKVEHGHALFGRLAHRFGRRRCRIGNRVQRIGGTAAQPLMGELPGRVVVERIDQARVAARKDGCRSRSARRRHSSRRRRARAAASPNRCARPYRRPPASVAMPPA